jgi:endonuclease-3 related protein
MVVDAYTVRLLRAFGYTFDSYDAVQAWCKKGLSTHFDEEELPKIYALFHGMIVEYVKANSKAKVVTISQLKSRI